MNKNPRHLVTTGILLASAILMPLSSRAADAPAGTAWRPGYPEAGLNDAARQLIAGFKKEAATLKTDNKKLRVLIIGDSLSDGYFHWSHYFRKALQQAYGDGGIGNINAKAARNPRDNIAGWLFEQGKDYDIEIAGPWRQAWASRDDAWPYLGWNGGLMSSDSPEASMTFKVRAADITVVYSSGTFTTWNGTPFENRAGGFTIDLDGKAEKIAPATAGQPLDIGLAKFKTDQGMHTLKLSGINSGWLWLAGLLLENDTPGVVVYNIANGGWWPYHYLWRQPGFEKILQAMNPDYVIYFLSKPDSGALDGSLADEGKEPEYRGLEERVKRALPNAKSLHMICWDSRSGENFPKNVEARQRRQAYFDSTKAATLNFYDGLDRTQMDKLGWFKDNIHLAQPGGEGIGKGVVDLFLPGKEN